MKIKSKAPFRLGLAGGGTDVSPYSDQHGGAILNATISLFAYTTIIPRNDNKIIIRTEDNSQILEFDSSEKLSTSGIFDLQIGVYNRIVSQFTKQKLSFELITEMDVSSGSGLGTSSTLVVSILGAFLNWQNIELSNHEIAKLAYDIERVDLKMAGGKQDQYAAAFGGINFMEFERDNQVIINPLEISDSTKKEMQNNLILYYTKTRRESAKIIETQAKNAKTKQEKPVQAMHLVKEQAFLMKEALLNGELHKIGEILSTSWENKKQMADGITNELIDNIYSKAIEAGATGGKISGAGGGGFMILYAEKSNHDSVLKSLEQFGGHAKSFEFCEEGLTTWVD